MKRFFRAVLFLLALCVSIGCLSGCQLAQMGSILREQVQQILTKYGGGSASGENVTQPVPVPDDYVYVLQQETYNSYTDDLGNVYNVSYTIPGLKLSTDDALEAAQEFQTSCLTHLEEVHEAMDDRCSLICIGISYQAWIFEDTLTLAVQEDTDWGFSTYFVYTFRLSDGELLEKDEMAERFGISEDALDEALRETLDRTYKNLYSGFDTSDEFYRTQLEKTVSDENLDDVRLYLSQDGELTALAWIYSLAGADAYQYHVTVELP